MAETTKKPGLWDILGDQHDKAAAERGTASMSELAGEHPNEELSTEGIYQKGRKVLAKAQLPKLPSERIEKTWDEETTGDPYDERRKVGVPPMEKKARFDEASAEWKKHLQEVEAELEREAREKANLPFKLAEQRLEARKAWEAGERKKAEAAEAELDRLAKIAGEYTPTDGAEYQRAAQAHFTKHYAREFESLTDADLDRAASEALTEYQKTHKGVVPTPAVMSRLTAKQLGAKAKDDDMSDASLMAGLGGSGSSQASRGAEKKPKGEEAGSDFFEDLRADQRRLGIIR